MFRYTSLTESFVKPFVKVYTVLYTKWKKIIKIKRLKSMRQMRGENKDNNIMMACIFNKC